MLLKAARPQWVCYAIGSRKRCCRFLGVHIKWDATDGTITPTQDGISKKIRDAIGIGGLNPVLTPAEKVLVADKGGDPLCGHYSFKSMIGMLLYVVGHSRLVCCMAVLLARLTHNPRQSHEEALEYHGGYLKGTTGKGLILKPTKSLDITAYVDTDFAGLAMKEEHTDPTSVKRRTGYIICVANCPIVWKSKLQLQTATSTVHAEYIL